ncbi:MAG: FapA family protein, partial [Spirochaetaceae bacterium]
QPCSRRMFDPVFKPTDIGAVARRRHGHDGHFDLEYRDGWAWLTVYASAEGGQPVYYEDVRNRMKLLGVPPVPYATLARFIEQADGVPRRLVEWPEGARLASTVTVTVAEDGMTAWVYVSHPKKGAAPPAEEDIVGELSRQGINFGVDRARVRELLRDERFDCWVAAAEGRPPVHARAAEIVYHFHAYRGKPYLELDYGRIDLRELNFIENRREGDLLAELVPPVEPRDGATVYGAVVPANTETHPVALRAGRNTRLDADGTAVYAAATGNVRLLEGEIIVEPVVTVRNVSYETGHIRHDGSVVVEGHVADGFIVEASGDIQVGKGVGKAKLRAGGHVLLKTGINGNGEGSIECDGNVFAKYVESSTVQCEGHLFVQEAIMHSRVITHGHCVLNGRRSEIVGSSLIVGDSLWCKQIGSVAEGAVYVSIGISPNRLTEFRNAKRDLDDAQEELERVERQLEQLTHAQQQGHREEKLSEVRAQLEASRADLMVRVPQLRRAVNELRTHLTVSRSAMLVAERAMYRGVIVAFGTREYRVPEAGTRATVLRRPGTEIEEHGFNPAEPPVLQFES